MNFHRAVISKIKNEKIKPLSCKHFRLYHIPFEWSHQLEGGSLVVEVEHRSKAVVVFKCKNSTRKF